MGVSVFAEREEHRVAIEKQIPVFDVVEVMSDSFSQIGVAAKTVHLSPTGYAGFHGVAGVVMRDVVLKVTN